MTVPMNMDVAKDLKNLVVGFGILLKIGAIEISGRDDLFRKDFDLLTKDLKSFLDSGDEVWQVDEKHLRMIVSMKDASTIIRSGMEMIQGELANILEETAGNA